MGAESCENMPEAESDDDLKAKNGVCGNSLVEFNKHINNSFVLRIYDLKTGFLML